MRAIEFKKNREKESFNEYINRFFELINQIKSHRNITDNQSIVNKILITWLVVIEGIKNLSIVKKVDLHFINKNEYIVKSIESVFQSKLIMMNQQIFMFMSFINVVGLKKKKNYNVKEKESLIRWITSYIS